MKHTLVLFLFFLSAIIQVQAKERFISSVQDSVTYYYNLSVNKDFSLEQQLAFIDKSINKGRFSDSTDSYLRSISRKSSIYGGLKDYDKAISNTLYLEEEAQRFKNLKYEAVASRKLGYYYKKKGSLIDVLENYQAALEKYKRINDSISIGKILTDIANIQNDLGIYNDSDVSATEALSYTENIKGADLTWTYNALARSSKEREDYEEALKWYKKALKVESSELSKATLQNNIALVYIEQEMFRKAIEILTPLLDSKKVIEDTTSYAKIKSSLGDVKAKLDLPEAEQELLEAYYLRKDIVDKRELYSSCIRLTNFYFKRNKGKAILYANEASLIAKSIKSLDAEIEALEYLFELSDSSKAKKYGSEYMTLTDSLNSKRNKQRMAYAGYKYNADKKEKENLRLANDIAKKDLEISKSQTRILILLFGILLLFLVSIVVYYIQKQKAKQKLKLSQLQERYQTETRLSKKVHDEVGNDIFYLMTQLENDPSLLEKNGLKLLDGLQNIYSKARDISREYTDIDTGDAFPEELLSLLNSFGNKEIKIITKQLEPTFWTSIEADLKSEVFRIVQELLTNMKKHSEASVTAVTFKKEARKLMIQYSDNGIGVDNKDLTLKSVENRIQVLQGVLTLDAQPDEGLQVSIIIPI